MSKGTVGSNRVVLGYPSKRPGQVPYQTGHPYESVQDSGFSYSSSTAPNVVAQFKFNEPSGDITSSVVAIPLVLADTGSPTYGVASTGADFANMTPGISTAAGDFTVDPIGTTDLDPGTGSWVLEWTKKLGTTVAGRIVLDTDTANAKGWQLFYTDATHLRYYIVADDSTTVDTTFTITDYSGDNQEHNYNITANRGAGVDTLVLKIDNVQQDTAKSIATLAGKTISFDEFSIGGTGGGSRLDATFFEMVLALNATHNSKY